MKIDEASDISNIINELYFSLEDKIKAQLNFRKCPHVWSFYKVTGMTMKDGFHSFIYSTYIYSLNLRSDTM